MPKKYKHIKLPTQLVGRASDYTVSGGPNIQPLLPLSEQENARRKQRIVSGLNKVEQTQMELEETADVGVDQQGYYELKMSLRRSGNESLLERFNITPYLKYEKTHMIQEDGKQREFKEEFVFGRVSTTKLRNEQFSDFDKLKNELANYVSRNELYSYFDKVQDIQPLTLDQVAEEGLLDEFNDDNKVLVDFVFGDDAQTSEIKMSSLEGDYQDSFVLKVNTEIIHYCRLSLTQQEIEGILRQYKGIIEVTHAPLFVPSSGNIVESDNIETKDETSNSINPIIVADKPLRRGHPLFNNDIVVDQVGDTSDADTHGTEVASLVVYGKGLPVRGLAKQKNKVIGLTATLLDPQTGHLTLNETLIQNTVEAYQSSDRPVIVNLSMNNPNRFYSRAVVNHLSVFLDELAHKYNCIFTISAGNMNEVNDFYANGQVYPDYYDDPHTTIFAPADSMNNLSIGSITYQESADSIAKLENPSPITRRGFEEKRFGFIKPDLVHHDSNCVLNNNLVEAEYNGPSLATGVSGITKNIGTSFAAPLVAHELGLLAAQYPSYKAQTLKALLVHFSKLPSNLPASMHPERVISLVGHGQTQIDEALNSLNTASTMVLEDRIKINSTKTVEIPIPSSLKGSHNLRLRLRLSIAYNPRPNPKDANTYCPINISAYVKREDDYKISGATTQSYINGAHRKSNIKKYPALDKSTTKHVGDFWKIVLCAESIGTSLDDSYVQPYSLVVTVEDIDKDDSIDIHQEVSQMIEVHTETSIDIEL